MSTTACMVRHERRAGVPINVRRTAVREFRYEGGGRARYLVQDREPNFDAGPPDPDNPVDPIPVIAGTEVWSEYDGVEIYADYTVVVPSETFDVSRMYLPGIAQMDAGAVDAEFYHADQIGSTRAVSSQLSAVSYRLTYSAFGEILETTGSVDTRYLYAGEHGYEAGLIDDWPFVHIGARWYDPMSGRFLQRDPIGIDAGLNVYEYVGSQPVSSVDPSGAIPDPLEPPMHAGNPDAVREYILRNQGPSAAIAGVTVAGVAAAAAVESGAATKALRWLNRGKFRIGPSKHEGVWCISIRWKNKHLDVPFIRWK